MKKDERKIMQEAIDRYGVKAQVDIAIEEMSELTKALLKLRREKEKQPYDYLSEHRAIENVMEEMADVSIVLDELALIYGGYGYIKTEKLERLEMRMKYGE